MRAASVGFHCPECAKSGAQQVYSGPPKFDPIVTKALIAANVAVAVYALFRAGSVNGFDGKVLIDLGLFGPFVAEGEWYRIFSSAFMHASLPHILFNMWALWALGSGIERGIGRYRYLALCFTSLLGGSFGVLLLDPNALTVGASGMVFGLFGALAALQQAQGMNLWETRVMPILLLNFVLTFTVSSISIGGHLGGFIAGAVIGRMYVEMTRRQMPENQQIIAAVVIGAALFGAAIGVA
jgi:membrane associated rhomboid family serine protease